MKQKLLVLMLVAGGSAFAQGQFEGGVGFGGPGPGPGYDPAGAYAAPPVCGPGSVWVDGYNDAYGNFVQGYCTAPPFAGAYWVAPRYFGGRFVAGYWGRGFAPESRFGFRGGYAPGARFAPAPRFEQRYGNGFRSAGPTSGFRGGENRVGRAAGPSNSFHQGGARGSGPATHGGGGGHGGRR